MADQLHDIVQRMVDAGESEDNIATVIQHFKSQPPADMTIDQKRASRDANLAAQAPLLDKASDVGTAQMIGAGEGATGGAVGMAEGVLKSPIDALKGMAGMITGFPSAVGGVTDAVMHPSRSINNAADALKNAPGAIMRWIGDKGIQAASDPVGFGQDIGSTVGQTALAAEVPNLPDMAGALKGPAASTVRMLGSGLEKVGKHSTFPLMIEGGHQIMSGDPKGILTMGMPAVMESVGGKMRRAGTQLPSTLDELNNLPDDVDFRDDFNKQPVVDQMNALPTGGKNPVTTRTSGPTHQQTGINDLPLASQMEMLPTSGPNPVRGNSAPPVVDSMPFNSRPLYQQVEAMTNPAKPESPIAQAALPPTSAVKSPTDLSLSPIEQAAMGHPSSRPAQTPVSDMVPPSKSSGVQGEGSEMSATPGLTVNDVKSLGMNPKIPIKKLSPEAAKSLLDARKARGASYSEQYYLQRRLDALMTKD